MADRRQILEALAQAFLDAFQVDAHLFEAEVLRRAAGTSLGQGLVSWARANPVPFALLVRFMSIVIRRYTRKARTGRGARDLILEQLEHLPVEIVRAVTGVDVQAARSTGRFTEPELYGGLFSGVLESYQVTAGFYGMFLLLMKEVSEQYPDAWEDQGDWRELAAVSDDWTMEAEAVFAKTMEAAAANGDPKVIHAVIKARPAIEEVVAATTGMGRRELQAVVDRILAGEVPDAPPLPDYALRALRQRFGLMVPELVAAAETEEEKRKFMEAVSNVHSRWREEKRPEGHLQALREFRVALVNAGC